LAMPSLKVLSSMLLAFSGTQVSVIFVLSPCASNITVVSNSKGQFGCIGWRVTLPCSSEKPDTQTRREGGVTSRKVYFPHIAGAPGICRRECHMPPGRNSNFTSSVVQPLGPNHF